jgi:hypothetical protein
MSDDFAENDPALLHCVGGRPISDIAAISGNATMYPRRVKATLKVPDFATVLRWR